MKILFGAALYKSIPGYFIFRFIQMRDTSYTVMGHSSTWANPSSTSLRSVSGCRRSWRTTSTKRTRTTVEPAPLSSPTASYYSTICNRYFSPDRPTPPAVQSDWSRTLRCSTCMCKRGLGLHPLSSPRAGCWRGNQPERQNESQLLTVPLSLSLCYWTIWTSFPSGGQREDQHKVHWAMRLHPNTGTLMERFAAQNTPCSLYWDLTFERLPVSDDLAGQLTDLLCSWVRLPLLVSQNFSVQCRVYEWMSGCIRP